MISYGKKKFLILDRQSHLAHSLGSPSRKKTHVRPNKLNFTSENNFLQLAEKQTISYTYATKSKVTFQMCIHVFICKAFSFDRALQYFFYTQVTFVFHLLGDFYIVHYHITVFWIFFLQKDLDILHGLSFVITFG